MIVDMSVVLFSPNSLIITLLLDYAVKIILDTVGKWF